jgi:tetratricopeptide (TPR) repeat protein
MKKVFIFRYLLFSAMIFVSFIALNICVFGKDQWKIVRTKEFQIVGNASEKDLQGIFYSIDQLETVFSKIFDRVKTQDIVSTNLIVFKNDKDFKPFKPIENGQLKDWVAGYFQPGEDVNYIALSAKENKENTNSTIFHEYTHSLVNNYFGQENVPPWINEGLAEYFEYLEIKKKGKIILGSPRFSHAPFDKTFQIMPLVKFLKIDYKSLRNKNEKEIESFYAQSWLLIHYILNGNNDNRTEKLKSFLNAVIKGDSPEIAYKQITGGDLKDLEKELENYLLIQNFPTKTLSLKKPLRSLVNPVIEPISEAEVYAFQGELLFNTNRLDEAEIYLKRALWLDPKLSQTNTSLGLIKMKEGNFPQAKKYLETALENDPENYLINYKYAYILSREDADNFGYIRRFDEETFENMRKSLQKSISLNPRYPEALYLLAFINLVQDSDYEESIKFLEKALEISPENQWYWMRLSEFYYRKENLEKAEEIARRVAEKTSDKSLVEYANRNLKMIETFRTNLEKVEEERKTPKNYVRNSDGILTEEEQKVLMENLVVEALNQNLRKPKEGEERMIGVLSKIVCGKNGITYLLETNEKSVKLKSATFENLSLSIFNYSWDGENFGCGSSFEKNLVIITFRPQVKTDSNAIGEIIGIEFVPNYFRFPEKIKNSDK